MKKGFRDGVPTRQHDLYAGVPQEVVQGLSSGFGSGVIQLLDTHHASLAESDLAAVGPGVVDELRGLLAMLRAIV